MTEVHYRYARGLLEALKDKSRTGVLRNAMQDMLTLLDNVPELTTVLESPDIDRDTKKRIVKRLFTGRLDSELLNLLMIIIDKGRENRLRGIAEAFIKLADRDMGIVKAVVTTPRALGEDQREQLCQVLSRDIGREVLIENRIDEGLLGGIVVHIGDTLMDGSLRGRLEAIKDSMYGAAAGRTGVMKKGGPKA